MSESSSPKPRRYPRAAACKTMRVAWRSGARQGVARVSTLGLGGLFIHETDPPPVGTVLQVIFRAAGGEVRARASVRNIESGRGMGVEFTQMRQEERARLSQLIKELLESAAAPGGPAT